MNITFYTRVILSGTLLTVVELLNAYVLGGLINPAQIIWPFLANLLIAFVAALYVSNAIGTTWLRLFVSCLTLLFVIGGFNILIESYLFSVTTGKETASLLFQSLIQFMVLSAFLTSLFKPERDRLTEKIKDRPVFGWVWRIALTTILYIVVYLIAGIILEASLPALGEFYKGKLPPVELVLYTQILRGLIFSFTGILFVKTCSLEKYNGAAVLGLIFSVVGGIAPLIPPNEFMPLAIRVGHGFEVGISNFVYGFLIGVILSLHSTRAGRYGLQTVEE